jgi:hypothetical protein
MTTLDRPDDNQNQNQNQDYETRLGNLSLTAQFSVMANSVMFTEGSLANRIGLAASLSLLNSSRAIVAGCETIEEGLAQASANQIGYGLDLEIVKMQLGKLSSKDLNTRFKQLLIDSAAIDEVLVNKVKSELSQL